MQLKQSTCLCGTVIMWGKTERGAITPLEVNLLWVEPKKGGKVLGVDAQSRAVRGDLVSDEEASACKGQGLVRVRESHFARCPKEKDVRAAMRAKVDARKLDEARKSSLLDDHPNHPSNPLGLHRRPALCRCGEPVTFIEVAGRKVAADLDELEVVIAPRGAIRGENGAILAALSVEYTDKAGVTGKRLEARLVVPVLSGQSHGAILARPYHQCAGGAG